MSGFTSILNGKSNSDLDYSFHILRDCPGFDGSFPDPVQGNTLIYANYLEEVMNWIQDSFEQYTEDPLPFWVYFSSCQPTFATPAGTYDRYNAYNDTVTTDRPIGGFSRTDPPPYDSSTLPLPATIWKLPYDRKIDLKTRKVFNSDTDKAARVVDSSDGISLFQLYFNDINTYLRMYAGSSLSETYFGLDSDSAIINVDLQFVHPYCYLADIFSSSTKIKNATDSKIPAGSLICYVGRDPFNSSISLVAPANAKNNLKAVGLLKQDLDPYASNPKTYFQSALFATNPFYCDIHDGEIASSNDSTFANTAGGKELYFQLSKIQDNSLLYLSTQDGKMTEAPDLNYMVQIVGQRTHSGTAAATTEEISQHTWNRYASFIYFGDNTISRHAPLLSNYKYNYEQGLPKQAINAIRPNSSGFVLTKDGHILYLNLLRAKKRKKVDDHCYQGKYAILDIDGKFFSCNRGIGTENTASYAFYNKGDSNILCVGHALVPQTDVMYVPDDVTTLVTVNQDGWNDLSDPAALIEGVNRYTFLYYRADGQAKAYNAKHGVCPFYWSYFVSSEGFFYFIDYKVRTMVKLAYYTHFNNVNYGLWNTIFAGATGREVMYPQTIVPTNNYATLFENYRIDDPDPAKQPLLSGSVGGYPGSTSINRIYSFFLNYCFVLDNSGTLYGFKSFPTSVLPFAPISLGGNIDRHNALDHAPMYMEKLIGVDNSWSYTAQNPPPDIVGVSVASYDGGPNYITTSDPEGRVVNLGATISPTFAIGYDFKNITKFGEDDEIPPPDKVDLTFSAFPNIIMINHTYRNNDAFLTLYEPSLNLPNPSVYEEDSTHSFQGIHYSGLGHIQLVIPGTAFKSDKEYLDFQNATNRPALANIGLVCHGVTPIVYDDGSTDDMLWSLEGALAGNALNLINSEQKHSRTLSVINDHSPFYVIVKDGYKYYVSKTCKKNRVSKLRIKVWPMTLPRSSNGSGFDSSPLIIYGNWFGTEIPSNLAGYNSQTNKYDNANNLGTVLTRDYNSTTGGLTSEPTISLNPNTFNRRFWGKNVGSAQLMIQRYVYGGFPVSLGSASLTGVDALDGYPKTYTIEIWDVTTSSGAIPDKMTFSPSNSQNNVVKISITGKSSYPHVWRSTNPGVAEVTYDPDVTPQDTRKAQITLKGTGQFKLIVTDSSDIPWRSKLITVS